MSHVLFTVAAAFRRRPPPSPALLMLRGGSWEVGCGMRLRPPPGLRGEFEEGCRCWRRAVALRPRPPPSLGLRGVVVSGEGASVDVGGFVAAAAAA